MAISKDPAFLFYSSDFLTGTMILSDEQVGKYIRLLCLQHQKGHLTKKDMLFICKTYDEDIYNKFKTDANDKYYNERLEIEIYKRKIYSDSRRKNRTGKTKDKFAENKEHVNNICKSYDEHMENENENRNEVEVVKNKHKKTTQVADDQTTTQIDALYAAYPKHVGRGQAIRAIRAALKKAPYETILAGVQRYVAERAGQDAQYTANPATWFNGERWTDVDPRAIKRENEKKLQDKRDRRAAELLDREIMEARAQKKI